MRRLAMLVVLLVLPGVGRAHLQGFHATLDTAQEVPAPTGTLAGAGGSALLNLDEDTRMLRYVLSVQNLTANPLAGHIHLGPPGTAGSILVTFDALPNNNGTISGAVAVGADVLAHFSNLTDPGNEMYVNFHTPTNGGGEIRGQIVAGGCSCELLSATEFKECVKEAIKALPKADRKSEKAVKAASMKAACGKDAGKKKQVACCLKPPDDPQNVVGDGICAFLSAKKCAKVGTQRETASCATACSPSGAFLDVPAGF